ncbi:SMC-Scp complex subunit ScpB [Wangella sp. NEAU-J3]|nr:SMC-Scp complex subunit ScpB [Jidongwangia harbinensis]MCA2218056.1 SMC-Scp complex subunit ScpB [Jidongwangia harbinensis]
MFDTAADDEVDDADIDLPFAEEVPDIDESSAEDSSIDESSAGESSAGEDAADEDADPAELGAGESGAGEPGAAESGGNEPDADRPDKEEPETGEETAVAAAAAGAAGRAGGAIPVQGRGSGDPAGAAGGTGRRTQEEEPEPPAEMDDAEMRAALEAVLLVVDEPVGEMQLAQILEQPTERVAAMLEDISARYTAAGHGFDLRRAAGGWRLYTRPEYAAYVERFVLDGQSVRLTQAALETLAVVAYKQPVTRSRISAIRGVNCDGVMRTLVTRGLVEECGTESETGAYLYRTTVLFLEKLGLNSVDQLPPLAPFLPDDVEEVLDASG